MSELRFFVNKIAGGKAEIKGEDFSHAVTVLRLKQGDRISVFNYEHGEFEAQIEKTDSKEGILYLTVGKQIRGREQPEGKLTAVISLIKNDKMEFILEKLTEIGADEIIPYCARRSVVKIKDTEKKVKRWEKIIYSAVKQSGRLTTPVLRGPVSSIKEVNAKEQAKKFFIWEKEEDVYLLDEAVKLNRNSRVYFITGPEGGFEESESAQIQMQGFLPVSIGNNILRAETAAVAAATVISQALRRGSWKK